MKLETSRNPQPIAVSPDMGQVAIDETPSFGAGLGSASHPHGRWDEMGSGKESNGIWQRSGK